MAGGDEKDMQTGAWVAGNAAQYNYLTHSKLKEVQACLSGNTCETQGAAHSLGETTIHFFGPAASAVGSYRKCRCSGVADNKVELRHAL